LDNTSTQNQRAGNLAGAMRWLDRVASAIERHRLLEVDDFPRPSSAEHLPETSLLA
jgi:hypothetical protein